MTKVWIGTCVLSSLDPAGRFWSGGAECVSLRLLLRAESAGAFETALRRSVAARGVLVEDISRIQTVETRYAGQTLSAAMQDAVLRADSITPLMVSAPLAMNGTHRIQEVNWAALPPSPDLWAVLDGVQWPGLPQLLSTSGAEHICLCTATDPQSLAAAPWLVRLDSKSNILNLIRKRPCDTHSGILIRAKTTLALMRKHLRRYTMVPTPIGGDVPQYFRFYDPRVMMDALTALERDFLAQILRPFSALILPLSPQTLLPELSDIPTPPSVFDMADACQDRLASVTWAPVQGALPHRRVAIDQAAFDRFGKLQQRRAIGKLARQLYDEHAESHSTADCTRAAQEAPAAAAKFGMGSLLQVTVMARAILLHGPAFWDRDRAAHDLLNLSGRLAWQRKDDLVTWLDHSNPVMPLLTGERR